MARKLAMEQTKRKRQYTSRKRQQKIGEDETLFKDAKARRADSRRAKHMMEKERIPPKKQRIKFTSLVVQIVVM